MLLEKICIKHSDEVYNPENIGGNNFTWPNEFAFTWSDELTRNSSLGVRDAEHFHWMPAYKQTGIFLAGVCTKDSRIINPESIIYARELEMEFWSLKYTRTKLFGSEWDNNYIN